MQEKRPTILTVDAALTRTGIGKTTMYKLIGEGDFPRPVDLIGNGRRVGFLESHIEAWIAGRVAASLAAAA